MFAWIRRNFLALVVLVAIGVSFAVSSSTEHSRAVSERDRSVVACLRNSERTALAADGQFDLRDARYLRDEAKLAVRSDARGQGFVDLIPAPPGFEGHRDLALVVRLHHGGTERVHISERARKLHQRGCEIAYPKP